MSPPVIDQRPRAELIAELYDRHAAGLYAYCHDQLGETTSAADALVSVLTHVPTVEPPRAALYALARREIYRRDITYAFPSVDFATDPASALIERVVREVRPHQREVLLLSAVCGLETNELAWVLDVAADTAEQLVISARHRFTCSLAAAVASVQSAPMPVRLAEVYDALTVAPAEDALARLPWRTPPATLRAQVLSGLSEEGDCAPAARPGASLWPTTPRWPLPLAVPDPVTNAVVFPAKELAPPEPGRRPGHEATTEPMPKVRRPGSGMFGGLTRPRRAPRLAAPAVSVEAATSIDSDAQGPADVTDLPDLPDLPEMPDVADIRDLTDTDVFDVVSDAGPGPGSGDEARPGPVTPFSKALATGQWPTLQRTFSLGRGETRPGTRRPAETFAVTEPDAPSEAATPIEARTPAAEPVPPAAKSRTVPLRPGRHKPIKMGEHHYDWLWELAGFLLCIAIALAVFFAVPTIVTP